MEVAGITIYGVLFLDWKQENPPFQGVSVVVLEEKSIGLTRL